MEWTNYTLALARAAAVCLSEVNPVQFAQLSPHLPEHLREQHEMDAGALLREFLMTLVRMLGDAETLHVRETAKQALGSELNTDAVPLLYDTLNTCVGVHPSLPVIF